MITKFKKPIALLLAVTMAMLLNFPSGILGIDLGLKASAAEITKPSTDGNGVYQIGTAAELYWFAALVNGDTTVEGVTAANTSANAKLTANITVNNNVLVDGALNTTNSGSFTSWTPIGNNSNIYTGTFDGQNNTISGLYFDDGNTKYVGLFGYVGSGGNVSNVGIVDSYFNGKEKVGGVCGYNDGTIENCYSTGAVRGTSIVGGVCGYNDGSSKNNGTIENCYSTGAVRGTSAVGGVCGYNYNYDGTIENCYSTGAVSGENNVGGVCGWNNYGTITNCYFDIDNYKGNAVGNSLYSSNITYVTDKTTNAFEKGEVCYLLQSRQKKDSGSGEAPMVWGQTIGIDKAPVLTSDSTKTVYKIGGTYSNTNSEITETEHNYGADFRCTNCGNYEAPKLNENVYEITNASQLYWFAEYVNNENTSAKAILKENIVVNKNVLGADGKLVSDTSKFVSWTPIGSMSNKYTGTFDGNGFYVSGLYFDNGGKQYVGLFGYVGIGGNVSNVGVVASYFNGSDDVGGVCGYNYGTITNCYNTGVVNGTGENVGGVCGRNNNSSKIENCYNTGVVNGSSYVGGVCGWNNVGTIENCYNTGAVNGSSYVGGVCGWNNDGTIENCYNTGAVKGSANVGGVCGYNNYNTIKNCYNTGVVSGTSAVGGVCGKNNGTIENCYYLDTTASDSVATSKTAAQFASGEVTYLLQSGQTADKNGTIPEVWGQTLTGENKQDYPVLGGAKVYQCTPCTGKYSNTNGATGKHTAPDTYDEYGFGKCKDCNADVYQPANLNNGVYEIGNAGQLYWFAQQVNSGNTGMSAELTDNITVNKDVLVEGALNSENASFRSWTPIGYYNDYSDSRSYTGTFNGQGHTISGLYFNDTNIDYVGLFGYVGTVTDENDNVISAGKVSNVGVVDSYFSGRIAVGGVCGYNNFGTIENCYNTGSVNGNNSVGGVCGYNNFGTIENCYNEGTVSGSIDVGGVCGNNYGTIENCYNTGSVSGSSGSENVGGVCGWNSATITNCYNTAAVSGSIDVGGVCGYNEDGTITNCYYLAESETDEIDGTTFKTAAQFGSGEVCYLLNGDQNTLIWGQTIGTDDYPVFYKNNTVYYGYANCNATDKTYSNSEMRETAGHKYDGENHACSYCGNAFAAIEVNYAKLANALTEDIYNVDSNGNIGEKANVTVDKDTGVVTCLIKVNGDEALIDTYTLDISASENVENTASVQIGQTKYKKTSGENSINIDMVQLVNELEVGSYTAALTLYDAEENSICNINKSFTVLSEASLAE